MPCYRLLSRPQANDCPNSSVKNGRFFGNEGVEDWLGPGTTTTNGLVETDLPPAPSNPADGAGDFHIEAITIVIAAAVATAALLGWML